MSPRPQPKRAPRKSRGGSQNELAAIVASMEPGEAKRIELRGTPEEKKRALQYFRLYKIIGQVGISQSLAADADATLDRLEAAILDESVKDHRLLQLDARLRQWAPRYVGDPSKERDEGDRLWGEGCIAYKRGKGMRLALLALARYEGTLRDHAVTTDTVVGSTLSNARKKRRTIAARLCSEVNARRQ